MEQQSENVYFSGSESESLSDSESRAQPQNQNSDNSRSASLTPPDSSDLEDYVDSDSETSSSLVNAPKRIKIIRSPSTSNWPRRLTSDDNGSDDDSEDEDESNDEQDLVESEEEDQRSRSSSRSAMDISSEEDSGDDEPSFTLTELPGDVPDFKVYNRNIAIFSIKYLNQFGRLNAGIQETDFPTAKLVNTNRHVVVWINMLENDTTPVTPDSFDSFNLSGAIILKDSSGLIEYMYVHKNSRTVKSLLLDAIATIYNQVTGNDILINIWTQNINIDEDVRFLVNYGFVEPAIVGKNTIQMKYHPKIPHQQTLNEIRRLLGYSKRNVGWINVFLPKDLAIKLFSYVNNYDVEFGGYLPLTSVQKPNGAWVLGWDDTLVSKGESLSVYIPPPQEHQKLEETIIGFHTHPIALSSSNTISDGMVILPPSNIDLKGISNQWLFPRPNIAHFICSPEGLWVVSLTEEFQSLLMGLRDLGEVAWPCINMILFVIFESMFQQHDQKFNYPTVTPITKWFELTDVQDLIKNLTLKRCFNYLNIPMEKFEATCQTISGYQNVRLYDISYNKWESFSALPDEGLYFTFYYKYDDFTGYPRQKSLTTEASN
ncbi:hypothetical protein MIV046R [Invertebrate iridescent virus 3]|uniref:Uncharacterized protein 229L n=1 Tax=Invertebrate iridescent virus 3 TaxID=345201 RepID=VF229_IIV3|nr:hypothetical protein MIV046R [Invertebrate iridescent virus 3]Q197B4.1 RecName: Full=Uncharacterized protein 229L [Invertebrate iridescent virus 3]ABF82076.1 hypothetical protein MIV046R [Invertebrate iridescent virus 3]